MSDKKNEAGVPNKLSRDSRGRKSDDARKLVSPLKEATLAAVASITSGKPKALEAMLAEVSAFISENHRDEVSEGLKIGEINQRDICNSSESESILFWGQTIRNSITGKTKEINNRYVNTIYVYFYSKIEYRSILNSHISEEKMKLREGLVREFRKILHRGDISAGDENMFKGEYALYHPFHLSPKDSVLVWRLSVGTGFGKNIKGDKICLGPFDCAAEFNYQRVGLDANEYYDGKIIKHGDQATIVLSRERGAHFLIHVDHRTKVKGDISAELSGIIIAAVDRPATAWPFYARRLIEKEELTSGVIDAKNVPPEAHEWLQRGAIHWQSRYYPGFPVP